MARIIHTGQALVDYVFDIPYLPPRGGNVYAGKERKYAGGAVHILVAAARAGATAVHAGSHGTGPNGDLIRAALAAEGVALSNPPEPDLDTGICVCLLEPEERTFITTMGAERRISVAALDTSQPQPDDIVCIDGYTLVMPETAGPMLAWLDALDERILTVLDPGADFVAQPADVREATLAVTRVWTSNLVEAQAYVQEATPDASVPTTMAQACEALIPILVPGAVIIVRDGPNGCAVHADGATTTVPGYPQTPVDTNGAGDAHTGALLAARLAGANWVEACDRANAAAAIKVTRYGQGATPTVAEVDAFLATNPPRS